MDKQSDKQSDKFLMNWIKRDTIEPCLATLTFTPDNMLHRNVIEEILGITILNVVKISKKFYEKIINEKDKKIEKLEKEIEELKYLPGNPGYLDAENHFHSLAKKNDSQ